MCNDEFELDFSIITVCYNSVKTIEDTIASILSQKKIKFEYIIIDGGSSDGTVDLIDNINDKRLKYTSEPDDGIYDAMNKGVYMARGKYIAILNSDDIYTCDNVLHKIKREFEENACDIVSGSIYYFMSNPSKSIRSYPLKKMKTLKDWKAGYQPPHPSTFIRKSVYDEIGLYDCQFRISSDYDFLFRALAVNKYVHHIIEENVVAMRIGGESTKSIEQIIIGNREVKRVWTKYNVIPPRFLKLKKILHKLFNI
ncbi:glycosyltransferase family 2 protein [Vibrio breoganii]